MQQQRIAIARDTLEILERGWYRNNRNELIDIAAVQRHAVEHTRLYTPAMLDDLVAAIPSRGDHDTRYEVLNETTLDAVRRLAGEGEAKILCLNFASAKNPGGGFLNGSVAQEEAIARASGLYPCLLAAGGYYEHHKKMGSCLYSDHMIYAPDVPVIKDEAGSPMDAVVTASVVTSAAVNAGVVRKNEPGNIDRIIPVMRGRVEKLLALCAHHGADLLVLGAWGCGVFQNDPEEIAELFHEALTGPFAGTFRRVVFAVKTNRESMIEPFRKRFDTVRRAS